MNAATLAKTESAHARFREGKYEEALRLYAEALAASALNSHRIALHSNRAACFLKLQKFKQAAEECSAVLELDDKHAGALMLRAQTLVMLKDYHSAFFDVNRLLDIDPASEAYGNLYSRIKTQLALAPIPEADERFLDSEPSSPATAASIRSTSPNTVLSPAPTCAVAAEPKPRVAASKIDYSRWDNIGDDLSDDDEEEEDEKPQYKYRLKTIALRAATY